MAKKKDGRNKIPCKAYKDSNRREKNKVKKIQRHLKKFPDDATAQKAVEAVKKVIKGYA